MQARLASLIAAARPRLMLWSPMPLMLGIAAYFTPDSEPPVWLGAALLLPCLVLLIMFRSHWLRFFFWLLLLITSGFAAAQLRAHYIETPLLTKELDFRTVEGTIDEIEPVEKRMKLVLSQPVVEGVPAEKTPQRLRISFRDDGQNWHIGDRVRMEATLFPLPQPVMPGGYDFARHFYFRSIGGNGFAMRSPEVIAPGQALGPVEWMRDLRHRIGDDMRAHMPGPVGAVAAAMTVSETGNVPEDTKDSLRNAGLAHMLAIAGLHLSIKAAVVFFAVRLLLTLYPPLALRLPVKKIAACAALASAFWYMLLAGAPVPTQRAFIMLSFLFLAMLLDRQGITLRTLSLAAVFILIAFPEAMYSASFQLSFSATLAIVAFYERFAPLRGSRQGWRGVVMHEALSILFTSLVATLATLPFILYSFNRFAVFGVLANMIVVPLAMFVIMPGMVLALLLMPFGCQSIGYLPLGLGTKWMIAMADWVNRLPYASLSLPAPSDAGIILCAVGLMWLCLIASRWRLAGLAMMALGLSTMAQHVPPELLISDDGRQVMARLDDGSYTLLKGSNRSFTAQAWLRAEGQAEATPLKDSDLDCDKKLCRYAHGGHSVLVVRKPEDEVLAEACVEKADLLIAWRYLQPEECPGPGKLIDRHALESHGAYAVWLPTDSIRIHKAVETPSRRLWNPHLFSSPPVGEDGLP